MTEFTFCIVTYNQEEYIGYLLESIKYQIINFAKDIKIDIIISDDLSRDNTVKIINEWTSYNHNLFRTIDVNVNEKNIGVVNNICYILKKLKTKKFKLIAGDDIFLGNNIFTNIDKNEFLFSPTIKFNNSQVIRNTYLGNFFEILWPKKKNIRKYMYRKLKNQMFIETPGVFYDASLLNKNLFDELANYNWIEDVPMWSEFLKRKNLNLTVLNIPLIGYRVGSGISTNMSHEKNEGYEKEVKRIQEKYHPDKNKYFVKKKYIWISRMYKYLFSHSKTIKKFVLNINQSECEAEKHIKKMIENYDAWKVGASV